MDTKIVAPPERTAPILQSREVDVPAAQVESAAKLENAGSIYLSPVVRIDNDTQTAVLQYRDPNTGKVLRQFPPKAGSDAYAQQEKRAQRKEADDRAAEAKSFEAVRSGSSEKTSQNNQPSSDAHNDVVV
jgi:hypothetical protein